jgi:hypothetical protein
MLVSDAFFAAGAEVEIFADRTLVANSKDWKDLAAVTAHALMKSRLLVLYYIFI